MLKRLELVGFKSFADKTEFTFATGITAIVGPNGSGKSKIADAVRWVLGEQSAKSLRGGEMTDVIFNGSASRRSLGLAEVTMTFDNRQRSLDTEAEEVQISRRVYRSGEGEYLINRQVCRLKDVKDLFLGSGAGADAYCIIEQGRVDVLLQASTKERRTIFEEAAGISRFKAKKTETLRRLERVGQNLQRLRDILDEVEKQLRSVKLQAAKAQRYQEYSERLKSLRVALGLREYHELSQELVARKAVLDGLRTALEEQAARGEAWETELKELEESLARLDQSITEQEAELAGARRQITAEETTLAHEWALVTDLENDLGQSRSRLAELTRHRSVLEEASAQAGEQRREGETQCQAQQQAVAALENDLQVTKQRLAALHEQLQRDQDQHLESMRQAGKLQNDVVSYKVRVDNLGGARSRLLLRSEQAAEHLVSLNLELQELTAADDELQGRLASARQALADLRQERDSLRQVRDGTAQRISDLLVQRSGLASRIEVLQGLELSHEGLGTGVREVFALLEQPDPGPWRTVMGIVADFFTVRREFAPLIDLALGERSQRFVVRDLHLLGQGLRQRGEPFSGRVSFLPLASPSSRGPAPPRTSTAGVNLVARGRAAGELPPAHPGVVALAEQVVRCEDPQLHDLPARLLGHTLIVRDLAAARAVAALGGAYRCVTLQGELLETDGTLTVGTHHAEAGILSRKSELRELRDEAAALDRRLADLECDLTSLRERFGLLDGRLESGQREVEVLQEQAAELRSRIGRHQDLCEGLHEKVEGDREEITALEREIQEFGLAWQKLRDLAAQAEAQVQELQAAVRDAGREIQEREAWRQQRQQEALTARVALAQVEERLSGLRARHEGIVADLQQRGLEQRQTEQNLDSGLRRLRESERALLNASSALASCYLRKESAERHLAEWGREREQLRRRRQERAEQAQAERASWRSKQEEAHDRELKVNDLRHRLDAGCARLREEYQLDLAEVYREALENAAGESFSRSPQGSANSAPTAALGPQSEGTEPAPIPHAAFLDPHSDLNPAAAAEEIAELRRKLSRLGSVNLDAIQELQDLEARASTLQIQYDDLDAAQRVQQDIIAHINADSRRLFTETFAAIRSHFQELFRKLFGGGMADVLLEDESDVLESGIEVVARPPGKDLLGISLMSGGEKTMTAVALLLAIFRSKPSPFCILDEADAALDEANIGRFTAVLRDFLDRSQFIIITHSKRTMACADALYGITMQESGISKRISVSFKDWPEDGQPGDAAANGAVRGSENLAGR